MNSVGEPKPFPSTIKPMLATLVDKPFSDPRWLFEPKLDGFRIVAFIRDGGVTLRSRNNNDLTGHYPLVAQELGSHPDRELVLDGEMVALNEKGLPDFNLMQHSADVARRGLRLGEGTNILYYPFDVLYVDGRSLLRVPLVERKSLLKEVVLPADKVKVVEYVEEDGESFFQASVKLGLEGMVAKRRDSIYQPGARSRSWLKVKRVFVQDFVVGGYKIGSGARSSTFGSLLLGYYDDGQLRYVGSVGSGFDKAMLEALMEPLHLLEAEECSFAYDTELAKLDARWVIPKVVVTVKFSEWTDEDRLRAPVFMGIRTDVDPNSVRREET